MIQQLFRVVIRPSSRIDNIWSRQPSYLHYNVCLDTFPIHTHAELWDHMVHTPTSTFYITIRSCYQVGSPPQTTIQHGNRMSTPHLSIEWVFHPNMKIHDVCSFLSDLTDYQTVLSSDVNPDHHLSFTFDEWNRAFYHCGDLLLNFEWSLWIMRHVTYAPTGARPVWHNPPRLRFHQMDYSQMQVFLTSTVFGRPVEKVECYTNSRHETIDDFFALVVSLPMSVRRPHCYPTWINVTFCDLDQDHVRCLMQHLRADHVTLSYSTWKWLQSDLSVMWSECMDWVGTQMALCTPIGFQTWNQVTIDFSSMYPYYQRLSPRHRAIQENLMVEFERQWVALFGRQFIVKRVAVVYPIQEQCADWSVSPLSPTTTIDRYERLNHVKQPLHVWTQEGGVRRRKQEQTVQCSPYWHTLLRTLTDARRPRRITTLPTVLYQHIIEFL